LAQIQPPAGRPLIGLLMDMPHPELNALRYVKRTTIVPGPFASEAEAQFWLDEHKVAMAAADYWAAQWSMPRAVG
jgi:hypothetical protein